MEALAKELHRLRAGIEALQGELNGLLTEFAAEQPHEQAGSDLEPSDRAEPAAEYTDRLEETACDPAMACAAIEPAEDDGCIADLLVAEPVVTETVVTEAETAGLVAAAAAETPVLPAEQISEPSGSKAQGEIPSDVPSKVAVLAHRRRAAPRNYRAGLRWAAAIALIAAAVAVAAASNGLATREVEMQLFAPEKSSFGDTAQRSGSAIAEVLRLRAQSAF